MIQLSFCIPTLNRTEELKACLDSIISQADESVEVVIVDGSSTDDNFRLIESIKKRFSRIRLHSSESKSGVDRDILQAVALAQGTFCWLFSDDDLLEEGALSRVLKLIQEHPDISGASLNNVAYDKEMEYPIRTVPAAGREVLKNTHLFSDRDECFSVLGVHLGFISCQVVRRALWADIAENNDLTPHCNAWIIVYMIGKMLERNPLWLYVDEVCVRYRSGNDSFISRLGPYKRQQITHMAYEHTISSLFNPGSTTYRNVFKILINDRMARTLAVLKARGIPVHVQANLLKLYFNKYWSYPAFWIKVIPIFFIPNTVMRVTEKLYHFLQKKSTFLSRMTLEKGELPERRSVVLFEADARAHFNHWLNRSLSSSDF